MAEFVLHPNVYSTSESTNLLSLLERLWVRHTPLGTGTFIIVSGFSNFNGAVRFIPTFRRHIELGGQVIAYLGGSSAQRLSSTEVVRALLECGVQVNLINRKRILHSKCYGYFSDTEQSLIVSSGNFTGPGISQNIESSLYLDSTSIEVVTNFSWRDLLAGFNAQNWQTLRCSLDTANPCWGLLYSEGDRAAGIDISEQVTMIVSLGAHDTARIMAQPGDPAGKGSQYFWLSRDSFSFFPPLTIPSTGAKLTYSCLINMNFVDLNRTDEVRVTFEAENNLDFRLGTGPLRYSRLAHEGDLALITRLNTTDYELRIIPQNNRKFQTFSNYAINFIGARGKRYGYIDNADFYRILNAP